MIYPQKLNSKNSDKIFYIAILISIVIGVLLIIINKLTTPKIDWASLANCGIIYIWITVIYSIKKSTNIAGHVLLQSLITSAVTLYIDYVTGKNGWSVKIAIPIILMVANTTMLILTIINHKRYIKYAIYQLIIVFISFIPIILMIKNGMKPGVLIIIGTSISILNFNLSIILCFKDIKEAIVRKFHM